jgi:hypothetical protein
MIKKICFFIFSVVFAGQVSGQYFLQTADLFQKSGENTGRLVINQNASIDTLISRYILMNEKVYQQNGYYGMKGWRIQIYSSSNRNAREESSKARAEFINKFPGIVSYPMYSEPAYFKVRVGDFRTKAEATKLFIAVSKAFPDAYIVPDVINFPELKSK